MSQSPVILFDGICNLCCGWVQFLIRHDKQMKFRFASLQSAIGQNLLLSAGINNALMESVVYLKGGQYFRESSAVLEILTDIGGMWKLFWIIKLIPCQISDSMYRFIAKRRVQYFGKRESCFIPTTENKKRFLT